MQYKLRSYFPARGALNFSSTSCPGVSCTSCTPAASAPPLAPFVSPSALALFAVTGTAASPASLAAGAALAGFVLSPPVSSRRCADALDTCRHFRPEEGSLMTLSALKVALLIHSRSGLLCPSAPNRVELTPAHQ